MCYVHNQWYDISCATLYILPTVIKSFMKFREMKYIKYGRGEIKISPRFLHISVHLEKIRYRRFTGNVNSSCRYR